MSDTHLSNAADFLDPEFFANYIQNVKTHLLRYLLTLDQTTVMQREKIKAELKRREEAKK